MLIGQDITSATHAITQAPRPNTDGNIVLSGAQVNAAGQASLVARQDISVQAVSTEQRTISERYSKSKSLLGSSTSTSASDTQLSQSQASTISARTVLMQAGRDAVIAGSNVVADGAVQIEAGRDLKVTTAEQTQSTSSAQEQRKNGLFASGASVTLGQQQQSQANTTQDH